MEIINWTRGWKIKILNTPFSEYFMTPPRLTNGLFVGEAFLPVLSVNDRFEENEVLELLLKARFLVIIY